MRVQFVRHFLLTAALTALIVPSAAFAGDDVNPLSPISSMVAVTSKSRSIPEITKFLVQRYAEGTMPEGITFPLSNKISDSVRTLNVFKHNVVVKWMDPLTTDESAGAPRFGANGDFIAFFGDGWNSDWINGAVGSSPMFNGSSKAGWVWTNHEYISNSYPTPTSAPNGQQLDFAKFLNAKGILNNNVTSDVWAQEAVDTYIAWNKKQVGGAWFRIVQDPRTFDWQVDREANAIRYDATSNTLVKIEGFNISRPSWDDQGNSLEENVVPGIAGDCSGGQSPWGTIVTAEENVQDYYGDFENCWSSSNRFIPGRGFDPDTYINPDVESQVSDGMVFGRTSNPNHRKDRDNYGFLAEIDPGEAPNNYYQSQAKGGDGKGHRKIGAMGRVRWENCTFAQNSEFKLFEDRPVVIYGGNDRRSGRIYKFVTRNVYTKGMTKAQVRALLDEGTLYVAHFKNLDAATGISLYDPENPEGGGIAPTEEAPGQGVWIAMDINNHADIAPNAVALGEPNKTVGAALQDISWNGIGGFQTNNDVLSALFTAATKLGVSEMNRPEDLEYNPRDLSGKPRIYAAFTNHTRPSANNQQGVLDENTPSRRDGDGSIFAMEEEKWGDPATSKNFTYWRVWRGWTPDSNDDAAVFAASDPDNIAIDSEGGVYFGTDGNPGRTGDTRSDAIYYLDLDPSHKAGMPGITNPTYGLPFRLIASPGDSEATGPWFTPDQRTMFFNVQHPGEDFVSTPSTWPQNREPRGPIGTLDLLLKK